MSGAFFTLYEGLPRQGPGAPEDVAWAAAAAGLARDARICDAGSGAGGDVAALLAAAPEGHVTAVDSHAPFIEALSARFAADPRVTGTVGDMGALPGRYDFIWSAGAVYFLGVSEALTTWAGALIPGGAVAFSEPCLFATDPSPEAVAFWEGYPDLTDARGIAERVAAAGFETVATRRLSDAAWEAYYGPMEARIAELSGRADRASTGPDEALAEVLAAARAEIAAWRGARRETGYLLSVVRRR